MSKRSQKSNRRITVDFKTEENYYRVIEQPKTFIDFVTAFILSIGCLRHYEGCSGKRSLTRHSHYTRSRLNGVPIWRVQCLECGAVFTILPHFVLPYRKMSPQTAENALMAASGGLSLEITSFILKISPMTIYRLICSLGKSSMVSLLTRCGVPLPEYICPDEKHAHCLTEKVYLPTIVSGRLIWHLGYTEDKTAESFEQSYSTFQREAVSANPSWTARGILTDGFESTISSMKKLFQPVLATVFFTLQKKSVRNSKRFRLQSVNN